MEKEKQTKLGQMTSFPVHFSSAFRYTRAQDLLLWKMIKAVQSGDEEHGIRCFINLCPDPGSVLTNS